MLIDAGAGALFGACCGRLPTVLQQAGYPAETIDAVLLTHVHGDHSGGLTVAGERVFPNADIYLSQAEYDYWMSDDERARAGESHKKMFAEGRAALAPYEAAGRLHFFTGETALFPEITAIPASGHTPGHSFYRIASQGQHVLVVGDIVHAAEVQFAHPNVTADFDADPAQARATRERTLSELAETHELVAAEHVSFPGLGHVTQNGSGYQWTRSLTRGRSPRRPSDPLPRDRLPVIHLSGIYVAGSSASA
ncbi:MBL fold metallo-hydrolase [Afifella sp. YEN Y35]|uniref:MBL fold metallo-hydrolase n=1 Tax=Afifella sp. YEN Y35 TaxID=3388337 RepID=UPI0039E14CF3